MEFQVNENCIKVDRFIISDTKIELLVSKKENTFDKLLNNNDIFSFNIKMDNNSEYSNYFPKCFVHKIYDDSNITGMKEVVLLTKLSKKKIREINIRKINLD
jgi:hypothetical protein